MELRTESANEFACSFGAQGYPAFGGFAERRLQFISLPLALYVRNTTVLYEMLSRLKGLRSLEVPTSVQATRDRLDEGGWKYSILVFLVIAAFQALYLVQRSETNAVGLLE